MTDTNILTRVSQGRAMRHVAALRSRGVRLATTDRNAIELRRLLVGKIGFSETQAIDEVERVLAPFELILADEYDHLRAGADVRLRQGGKPDWPALAAAIAFDAEIWSEDVDYFGVGVPVWTTDNLSFVKADNDA